MSEHGPKCQQFELYAAERGVPLGQQFNSPEEIERWVNALRETWWWQTWYPKVRYIEVYGRPDRMNDSVGSWHREKAAGKLEMRRSHWNAQVVLHELAHVLADARYGSKSHDPWFARVYLELMALVLGSDAYAALAASFDQHNIKHQIDEPQPPLYRARQMPPVEEPHTRS